MDANEICLRLKGVKRTKKGFTALCPAHDDHKPSLSIRQDAEKVLVKCHAGCKTEAVVHEMGLHLSDLFIEDPAAVVTRGIKTKSVPCATYDYVDEHGHLIFQIVRWPGKNFKARTPNPDGGWSGSTTQVRRVIYNLPSVIKAISHGTTIYITEGEKDADRLISEGLVATTNPFGAGKWQSEYSRFFADADCVLLPDNDPAGKSHMDSVARSIVDVARCVRVVQLPGLNEKEDVSDWLSAGHTIDELRAAGQAGQTYDPLLPVQRQHSWADLPEDDEISWLWKFWLARGYVTMVVAEAGVGKSYLALRLGAAALGILAWPDGTRTVDSNRSILWGEAEAGEATNKRRARQMGLPLNRIRVPFDDKYETVRLDDPAHMDTIHRIASQDDIELIIIDSLSSAHSRDENTTATGRIVTDLAKIARDTNKAIILIHHLNKPPVDKRGRSLLHRIRGSSAIYQSTRIVIALYAVDELNPNALQMAVIKSNLSEKPTKFGVTINADGVNFGEPPAISEPVTQRKELADWLKSRLRGGPVASVKMEAELLQMGYSVGKAKRMKPQLGIESHKVGDGWEWRLPVPQEAG